MKRVLTYGTFDLLHRGHVRLLERAAALGDELIVGLSTDEFNRIKGKHAYMSYADREYILKAIRYVDRVIPERSWDQKVADVQRYHIDTFVMGDDWQGKFDFLKDYCEVIYLPRTQDISTTKIKTDLSEN
ncbi:glycerol-3-phosphate cytidylyltransferase [Ligilactobacillus hohenheimensis]|uniref:glycerol-3-phosphate cytidylyltransferase n=1 Tax=Ligilactobacillus hohenheimensis TaxID=2991832 RepID=UPI0024B8E258|nr:glycerol-3-phosphate cytidylyltransferase [Ligilactobacillus hohenheimensis]